MGSVRALVLLGVLPGPVLGSLLYILLSIMAEDIMLSPQPTFFNLLRPSGSEEFLQKQSNK